MNGVSKKFGSAFHTSLLLESACNEHTDVTSGSLMTLLSWRQQMDTRLNSTVTVLRIAIGLMATLAGLDKFFNLLANWEAYIAPVAQQFLPVSAGAFMAVAGVIEFAV